jgi:hypothetical protein
MNGDYIGEIAVPPPPSDNTGQSHYPDYYLIYLAKIVMDLEQKDLSIKQELSKIINDFQLTGNIQSDPVSSPDIQPRSTDNLRDRCINLLKTIINYNLENTPRPSQFKELYINIFTKINIRSIITKIKRRWHITIVPDYDGFVDWCSNYILEKINKLPTEDDINTVINTYMTKSDWVLRKTLDKNKLIQIYTNFKIYVLGWANIDKLNRLVNGIFSKITESETDTIANLATKFINALCQTFTNELKSELPTSINEEMQKKIVDYIEKLIEHGVYIILSKAGIYGSEMIVTDRADLAIPILISEDIIEEIVSWRNKILSRRGSAVATAISVIAERRMLSHITEIFNKFMYEKLGQKIYNPSERPLDGGYGGQKNIIDLVKYITDSTVIVNNDWLERIFKPNILYIAATWENIRPVLESKIGILEKSTINISVINLWKSVHEEWLLRLRRKPAYSQNETPVQLNPLHNTYRTKLFTLDEQKYASELKWLTEMVDFLLADP